MGWRISSFGGPPPPHPASAIARLATKLASRRAVNRPRLAQPTPIGLLAEHLYDQPLGPAPVELGVEDLLPGAEVEAAVGDRKNHLVVDEEVLEVGVAVVLAAGVVAVVAGVG